MIYEPFGLLWVKGKQVSASLLENLRGVNLTLREGKATTGDFSLKDPDSTYFDSKVFKKGTWVAFILGWTHEMEVFGPYVVKTVKPDYPEGSRCPTLTVVFQDLSHKMNKAEKQRKHTGKPKDILKRIAKEYGLGYDISSMGDLEYSDDFPLNQANQTDAAMLQRIADRYGYVWGIDGVNLFMRRPAEAEAAGYQVGVPVLSYAAGTLRSFSPEIKFSGGGSRKDAKNTAQNIDLTGSAGDSEATSEGDSGDEGDSGGEDASDTPGDLSEFKIPSMRESLKKLSDGTGFEDVADALGDELGDEESTPDNAQDMMEEAKKDATPEERKVFDSMEAMWKSVKDQEGKSEAGTVQESKPRDPGAASPATPDEAVRRSAAKALKSSEVVTGTFVPPVSSVWYKPGKSVILDLPSARLSGRYRIREVGMGWNKDGFKQTCQALKRKYLPSPKDKEAIAQQQSADEYQQEVDSFYGVPGTPEAVAKGKDPDNTRYNYDASSGKWKPVQRVDGKVDAEAPVESSGGVPAEDVLGQKYEEGWGGVD